MHTHSPNTIPNTTTTADEPLLNQTQLAAVLNIGRATVSRWVADGYELPYGRWTTASHAKAWLRDVYAPRLKIKRTKAKLKRSAELERFR